MISDDDSEELDLDISLICAQLKKNFDPEKFAQSLLPDRKPVEDYDQLIDDLDENLQSQEKCNTVPEEIKADHEKLRLWSHVKFKEQLPAPCSEAPEFNDGLNKAETETKQTICYYNDGNISERTEEIKNVINTFLHEEANCSKPREEEDSDTDGDLRCLPIIESSEKKFFRFFYLNAYENLFGDRANVHLFGKTYCPQSKKYKSCCIVVGPLKRRIYVLPRICLTSDASGSSSFNKIHMVKEFYLVVLKPLRITEFNFRFVMRKNLEEILGCEPNVFLEIEYSAKHPMVEYGVEGHTFVKVLGVKNSCFENFVLDKKLKGPCWVDITNPLKSIEAKTWCIYELMCSPDDVSLSNSKSLQVPPVSILSMHIKCDFQNNEPISEVKFISWAVCSNYNISRVSLDNVVDKIYCAYFVPQKHFQNFHISEVIKRTCVKAFQSEKELLLYFLNEYHKIDPDILVAYNFENHDLHNFISRLLIFNIHDSTKLGRFRHSPKHSDTKTFIFDGRLICDMKNLIEDLILFKKHNLKDLYEEFIIVSDSQRLIQNSREYLDMTSPTKLLETIILITNESKYLLELMLKTCIIPLCFTLTNVCGNSLSQTFCMGVSKRSEFLLLHAFFQAGFIIPHRITKKISKNENLVGSLVLKPKIGLHDDFILLMDFQSLYPSIIHEYNICLSHSDVENINYTNLPGGVLPSVMLELLKQRESVKKVMDDMDKDSNTYFRYSIYQSALKLCANGIYGCLASPFFRFYSPHIAQNITQTAREILANSVSIIESKGFEVIYGDTDSIMMNTKCKNLDMVYNLVTQVKNMINCRFTTIQLKVDTIFRRVLIISKKKYAGLAIRSQGNEKVTYDTVLKGLDIVRNDRPAYLRQMGKCIIDHILSEIPLEDKVSKIEEILKTMRGDLLNRKIPFNLLTITKVLSQDPESYLASNRSPWIQLAKRLNKYSGYQLKKGDQVSYVMCSNLNNPGIKKAFHLSELLHGSDYFIDSTYYLNKEFYPYISRLCECFTDIDSNIVHCLDLRRFPLETDAKNYFEKHSVEFDPRDPFIFSCSECANQNEMTVKNTKEISSEINCRNCSQSLLKNSVFLKNKLVLILRKYISKYYNYQIQCTSANCKYSTRRLSLNFELRHPVCSSCRQGNIKQTYSEIDLFLQLEYFKKIFSSKKSLASEDWIIKSFDDLLGHLNKYKLHSEFETVDLYSLFK